MIMGKTKVETTEEIIEVNSTDTIDWSNGCVKIKRDWEIIQTMKWQLRRIG